MDNKQFLSLQKAMRVLTIILSFGSAIGSFGILALLMGNHAIQINSITAKIIFFLIGALSTITFFHMLGTMARVRKNGETDVDKNVFLYDSCFQGVSILAIAFVNLSFAHLLKQPYTYQSAIDNSHLLIAATYTLIVFLFLTGITALTCSIMKNYSLSHPEIVEKQPLKVSLNTKSEKEQRKAPRKKEQ